MKIDKVDRLILSFLIKNGRITLQEISSKIGISRVAIAKRIEKLEKEGLIKFSCLLDLKKLNWRFFIVNIDSKNPNETLANICKNCPRVILITKMTGNYNLQIICASYDLQTLRCFIEKRLKPNARKCEVLIAEPPEEPQFLYISLENDESKNECNSCEFKTSCLGCPLTKNYKYKNSIEGAEI